MQRSSREPTMNHIPDRQDLAGVVEFPHTDGSRVPYTVFNSPAIYAREQERIYRGPVWNFVGFECEIPNAGDFKSTFIGDTPVAAPVAAKPTKANWIPT